MFSSRSRSPLFLPLFLALLGVLFTFWNAWDAASVPCFTAGCTLYQQFSFGGFSLWWAGTGLFILLMVCALLGRGFEGRVIAGTALLIDCVLLIVMIGTMPCVACLMFAFLLAICFVAFQPPKAPHRAPEAPRRPVLLYVWSILFLLNLGVLCHNESQPWAMLQAEDTGTPPVQIYFSPSCSACKQLVTGISPAEAKKITWFPVGETPQDLAIIMDLNRRLAISSKALSETFAHSLDAAPLSVLDMLRPEVLLMQYRLWRNQSKVLKSGGYLPLVEFRGVPTALLHNTAKPADTTAKNDTDYSLPIDLGEAGNCSQSSVAAGTPCP